MDRLQIFTLNLSWSNQMWCDVTSPLLPLPASLSNQKILGFSTFTGEQKWMK